jgi:hypothetical protein
MKLWGFRSAFLSYVKKTDASNTLREPLKLQCFIACVLVAQPVCRGKYNNFLLLLITFQVS